MGNDSGKKLGTAALAALVVSAMIGGGIFSLPQNMAQGAGASAVILAWVITGIGMYFIASTFRILAEARPDATTGIYAYARLGFGRFAGFQMAWAYWLCNIFGNVGYAVLLMDALDYFFPGCFKGGNNLNSVIGGSIVIWLMNWAVLRGIRQASFMNVIGTICKLVPIFIFIIGMLCVFRWNTFTTDMSGQQTIASENLKPLGSMLKQIRSTMLVTLWAFLGIEGAVVVSGKAKDQRSVGSATLLGFLGCLVIYTLISVLPFGRMTQVQIASLANPSCAGLLRSVTGNWGADLMNSGVIIAIFTSWLAFTIMIAQIPYAAAQDGTFPRIFKRENQHEMPDVSLYVTSIIMQIAMIAVYFASNAWNSMLSVTSVMALPPYLACTAYLWKLCITREYPEHLSVRLPFACFCGAAGSVYALWMIYAAGLKYLLMAFVFLALGIPVFCRARRNWKEDSSDPEEQHSGVFTKMEKAGAAFILAGAIAAVILFATKTVTL